MPRRKSSSAPWLLLLALFTLTGAVLARGSVAESLREPDDCISSEQRAYVRTVIARHQAKLRAEGIQPSAVAPTKYPFYPLSGTLDDDMFINNYVDLDASGSIRDWNCQDHTYDGHNGHDTYLLTNDSMWEKMDIGYPIFAALDGTVIDAHDGEFDRQTGGLSVPDQANYVILFHGGTQYSWYWHMRKNSVAVSVGQQVKAGTQLGLVGSSGKSTGPHLHFESQNEGKRYEPYSGGCQPTESAWVSQQEPTSAMKVRYLRAIENETPDGTVVAGNRAVGLRVLLTNLPASSTLRIRYRKPDGAVQEYPNAAPLNNPFYRVADYYIYYNVNFDVTGIWKLDLEVNGVPSGTIPLRVVASAGEATNQPPLPITGRFDPPHPLGGETVFCRVQTTLGEDPDYSEVVRFHYQWFVNGTPLRDVVSVGKSDALPKGSFKTGDLLRCVVTPSDGIVPGPANTVEVQAGREISGRITLNGEGLPNVTVKAGDFSGGTNSEGNYRIGGLTPGSYTVTPQPGEHSFTPSSRNVTVAGDMTGVDFTAARVGLFTPTNARVTVPEPPAGSTRLILSWIDTNTRETGYAVERALGAGSFTPLATTVANSTSYTNNGLTPDTAYRYRVRAVRGTETSGYSAIAIGRTLRLTPTAPTRLTVTTPATPGQLVLTWTDASTNETGFKIERKGANGAFSAIGTTAANITTFTNNGLAANTAYTYQVRAVLGPAESAAAGPATGTTLPTAPTNLVATPLGSARIRLAWSGGSGSPIQIERRTGTAAFARIATTQPATTNTIDVGLASGRTYIYRLRAANAGGTSAYSNEATATTFPALLTLTVKPTKVKGGKKVTGKATLGGAAPAGGVLLTLTSNSTLARIPTSIRVPQGKTAISFSFKTAKTKSAVQAILSASDGDVIKTARLRLTK